MLTNYYYRVPWSEIGVLPRFSKGQGVNLKKLISQRRSTIKRALPIVVRSFFLINILMITFVMVTCLKVSSASCLFALQ